MMVGYGVEVEESIMREAFARKLDAAMSRDENTIWPRSFELAMVSPIYSRLVYIEALHGEANRVQFKPDSRELLSSGRRPPHRPSRDAEADGTRYWWQDRD